KKYAIEILEKTHMVSCNPSQNPVDTESFSKFGCYYDTDWAGCPTTWRSTSGYCVFLGNNLISWSAKRQPMLSWSSAEVKYRGVANAVAETFEHQRTKHIEIDIHFVYDLVVVGQVRVLHVPSRYQFADIFTKGLPSALFEELRSSLSIQILPAPTAREC
nr:hypothetical protein [Tanacetum cinerariifolium]